MEKLCFLRILVVTFVVLSISNCYAQKYEEKGHSRIYIKYNIKPDTLFINGQIVEKYENKHFIQVPSETHIEIRAVARGHYDIEQEFVINPHKVKTLKINFVKTDEIIDENAFNYLKLNLLSMNKAMYLSQNRYNLFFYGSVVLIAGGNGYVLTYDEGWGKDNLPNILIGSANLIFWKYLHKKKYKSFDGKYTGDKYQGGKWKLRLSYGCLSYENASQVYVNYINSIFYYYKTKETIEVAVDKSSVVLSASINRSLLNRLSVNFDFTYIPEYKTTFKVMRQFVETAGVESSIDEVSILKKFSDPMFLTSFELQWDFLEIIDQVWGITCGGYWGNKIEFHESVVAEDWWRGNGTTEGRYKLQAIGLTWGVKVFSPIHKNWGMTYELKDYVSLKSEVNGSNNSFNTLYLKAGLTYSF